ncbi:PAS domain S-box protein [Clostridium botulinum]|uniref:histidine kinase n=2 Tax=Clostridium TaxID=1485 RepID=A0A9P2G7G5_CLOBO|nr:MULTISPECIES: ATP-binding protein [Clostridium]NFV47386.1 PAS domain S-box protein [Clostridium botulinum]AYF55093.1 PAS domain-containing sensor histidine kinase [Clostridium novyi]EES91296.1 PAS/PAC sensor signal transduction histidine kinase [Clostridium botulinum D str. 1873]MCD3244528.1 PAS domain S-box protein [Clostridium botulinum C]MCD3261087.1 PAS domain S-box protein [Clostridium botulinum C]
MNLSDALKEIEERRLYMAIEQSTNGILIVDINGIIEYANKGIERIIGIVSKDFIGKHISIFQIDDYDKIIKKIIEKVSNNNMCNDDLLCINKRGEKLWLNVIVSPIRDKNLNIINFLIQANDVTYKNNLINILDKKNKELDKALKLLKQTQVKLLREDKMVCIGQLSAGIAHEINNPLGFVMSNFNTLKKYVRHFKETLESYRMIKQELQLKFGENINKEIEYLNKIEKKNKIDFIIDDLEEMFNDTSAGLERVRKIIYALRNFAHENNNGDLQQYDLNEGIENTLIIVKNEIKYTSQLKLNLTNIPLIKAKPNEINQCILNIIINASYAIKEKISKEEKYNQGNILISTTYDESYVYCSIEDDGIGIPYNIKNKIFEPFFTTKPIGKGTGLGLSITYEIIKNTHKGELIIESEENIGTKITIKLPINCGED